MTRSHAPIWLLVLAPSLACGSAAANRAQRARGPDPSASTHGASVAESAHTSASSGEVAVSDQDVRAAHDEIQHLYAEIRDWSHELRLGSGFPCGRDAHLSPCVARDSDAPEALPGQVNDLCTDTCSLGERICENAEEICVRARRANDNTWAADKCAASKGTCRAATSRCCTCTRKGDAGSPPLIL